MSERIVSSNEDNGGSETLRQTIIDADAGDTIIFNLSAPNNVIALETEIEINKSLTIQGLNSQNIIINGTHPNHSPHRIFYIDFDGSFIADDDGDKYITLKHLTLINGGGDSFNESGGGIYCVNNGVLELDTITMNNNQASYAGALYIENSTVDIKNSFFSENSVIHSGGALYVYNSMMNIKKSSFDRNVADVNGDSVGSGGALYVVESIVNIKTSSFSENSAALGGAIYLASDHINMFNVSMKKNNASAHGGSIDLSEATATIMHLTISEDECADSSIHIHPDSSSIMTNVTISENKAGVKVGGTLNICNSTIVNNGVDVIGIFNSNGNNVFGNVPNYVGDPATKNDLIDVANPGLLPMANYGGIIETMMLEKDSVAIKHGSKKCYLDTFNTLPDFFKENDLKDYDCRAVPTFLRFYKNTIDAAAVQFNQLPRKKRWFCKTA